MRCEACDKVFARPHDLRRHKEEQHGVVNFFECDKCSYKAKRPSHLSRHKRSRHSEELHTTLKIQIPQPQPQGENRYEVNECAALRNRLKHYRIKTSEKDPLTFLHNLLPQLDNYIAERLLVETGLKLQIKMSINFRKPTDTEAKETFGFFSHQIPIFRGNEYDVTSVFPKIMLAIDAFQRKGSGWVTDSIEFVDVYLLKYQPLRGNTYSEIPKELKNKAAIINIKNKDEKCFMWSVLAMLHPTTGQHDNPNRVSKYKRFENELDFTGIDFPVQLPDIKKFEQLNSLAINVYVYEDFLRPLRISDLDYPTIHILLHEGHYSLIKDLNRLLHDQRRDKTRKFFCPRCLIPKTTEEILQEHIELCKTTEPTKVKMPEDAVLKFKNTHKMLRQPLTVYADFECLTTKIDEQRGATQLYQKHIPCGYGFIEAFGCCGAPEFSKPTIYRGSKIVEKFLLDIIGIANEYQKLPDIPLDKTNLTVGNTCHICKKKIVGRKVLDHCHICGKFRGATHNDCNQAYRLGRDVNVVFHNLRRYDGHLIMQEIGEIAKMMGFEIDVTAKAMEDYISFSLIHKKEEPGDRAFKIRFIDSLQFLNCSLDGLVSNLEDDKFIALRTCFKDEKLALAKRKGIYPYDYMDSEMKFKEQLPAKEAFFSKLTNQHITPEEYDHAKMVWQIFDCNDMGDYHDHYLNTDVLLLADVFEEFRRLALEKYELDPCHYLTAPSLTWDACLLKTKVELELFDDPDMYIFCERGIRGGVSHISHRYAEANNPLVPGYDASKPTTYIPYWDANNLYGYAMSQKLPVDGFRWLTWEEIQTTDFNNIDGDVGYILEVDLDYPEALHEPHNDYPLAPESMEITQISPYSQTLKVDLELKVTNQTKLVPNLNHKRNYILHGRALKLYRELKMELKRVHRVLKFNQRAWLAEYIDLNTQMRAQAKNSFEKDLFKLMNNAVFGKTMENVRKYRDIELVTREARLEKLVANPRFSNSCRFNDNLVGISMLKASCTLCKPIYIGLSVLDLSKELMYRFHYQYIVPKYGQQAKLLFTDTDSLCYKIETKDIYQDMKEDGHLFDFSDYPPTHVNYSTINKKVIGKMKDETSGNPIWSFCGLRSKMYSMEGQDIAKRRAKGVKRGVVKKMKHDDYVRTLFSKVPMKHRMTFIRNHLHELYSQSISKVSLSPYDDKRWILKDGYTTRAHGHFKNQEEMDTD